MMLDLINDIKSQFGNKITIECPNDCSWLRIEFGTDRHKFLSYGPILEGMIKSHEFGFKMDTGWKWEDVQFEGKVIHNPTTTYKYFITKLGSTNVIDISDTIDPIYDISLFELKDFFNKTDCVYFDNYSRTLTGFNIKFSAKAHALAFEKSSFLDILGRDTSWEKFKGDYVCNIYCYDKNDACAHVALSSIIPTVKKRKSKLSQEEMFAKIQSGEMSLEDFKKLS